jgi:hypothetical protein
MTPLLSLCEYFNLYGVHMQKTQSSNCPLEQNYMSLIFSFLNIYGTK